MPGCKHLACQVPVIRPLQHKEVCCVYTRHHRLATFPSDGGQSGWLVFISYCRVRKENLILLRMPLSFSQSEEVCVSVCDWKDATAVYIYTADHKKLPVREVTYFASVFMLLYFYFGTLNVHNCISICWSMRTFRVSVSQSEDKVAHIVFWGDRADLMGNTQRNQVL